MKNHLRRDLLKKSALAGAGLTAAGALGGLVPKAHAATTLNFKGWDYEPDLVRENINLFEKHFPDVNVKYEAVGGNYNDKMAALFVAESPLDCLYVRDTYFAAWVEAGWLRDLEGLPGVDGYKNRIYPGNMEMLTYDGKMYGLPYYTDFHVWAYRDDILKQGDFFDKNGNPLMHEDDRFAKVLQWFIDGIYKYEYIDPKVVELDTNNVRDAMAAGAYAYGSMPKYDVERVNSLKYSKVPGKIKMMGYPALQGRTKGTVSWTRMYSLTSHVKDSQIDAAWKLIQFLGGMDKNGSLYTAKRWYLLRGLGFAYPELWNDSEISSSTARWADINVINEIGPTSRPIEIIKTPWYYDFERNMMPTIQGAITRKSSVSETLNALAKHARKVKKEWD